jgi:hypothetical protein
MLWATMPVNRLLALVLVVLFAPTASLSAQTVFPQTVKEKPPERRAPTRPPMEGSSFDVGRYEIRQRPGQKDETNFVGETAEIEAKVGNAFGFIWRLRGFSGTRLVPIVTKVKHPPFVPKGKTEPQTLLEEKTFFRPINGTNDWPFIYRFDSDEELVPGEWVLSVFYDTQLIAQHSFKVIAEKR